MSEPVLLVVATGAEVTMAAVAVESFLDHHPGRRVAVVVVDDGSPGHVAGPAGSCDRLSVESIGLSPDVADWASIWGDVETARRAVVPWAVAALLDQGASSVLVLPPDAWVHRSLDEVCEAADGSLTVVPRVVRPLPQDGLRPDLGDLAVHGALDGDIVAVGAGLATREVLGWWKREVQARARYNTAAGRPGAWVPPGLHEVAAVCPHRVVRSAGVGVGLWNLHERALSMGNEGIRVNGDVLRLMRLGGLVEGPSPVPWGSEQGRRAHPASATLVSGLVLEYLNQVQVVRYAEVLDDRVQRSG